MGVPCQIRNSIFEHRRTHKRKKIWRRNGGWNPRPRPSFAYATVSYNSL